MILCLDRIFVFISLRIEKKLSHISVAALVLVENRKLY
jgi:hypothetical protein